MKKILLYLITAIIFTTLAFASYTNINIAEESEFDQYNVQHYFVNQDPDPAEPGEYVTLKWKVENTGYEEAENVWIELIPEYPFALHPSQSRIRKIGSVWGKQLGDNGIIVEYKLKVDEDAVEGDNPINIRYSYDEGKTWAKPEPYYVTIRTHDAILNVNSVTSTPSPIPPGEEAEIELELGNIADSLLKDIKINLGFLTIYSTSTSITQEELPFSPIGTTDSQSIKKIESGENITIKYKIIADSTASSGVYKIPLTIIYNDELGTNYSKSEIISLIVGDKPKLDAILQSSDIYKQGQKGSVNIDFINKGAVNVKFLDVELEPNGYYEILSPRKDYLGNIDSDDYESAEYELFVKSTAPSKLPLKITYHYFDSNNQEYEKHEEITLILYDEEQAKTYGLEQPNQTIGIVIVIAVIIVGLIIYSRIKKNKKKKNKK